MIKIFQNIYLNNPQVKNLLFKFWKIDRQEKKNDIFGFEKNITIIIKTFESPQNLNILIKSIKKFYPSLKILVADDSKRKHIRKDVSYFCMPFDSGISAGRNLLLSQVQTKYFLLLDDDFCFTKKTRIDLMVKAIKSGFDLVGGAVEGCNYFGLIELKKEKLIYKKGNRGQFRGYYIYDIVPNFFLGKTSKIRKIGWDNSLKLAEHTDFFLRVKSKIKITYLKSVQINHRDKNRTIKYKILRNGGEDYSKLFLKKWKIKKIDKTNFAS